MEDKTTANLALLKLDEWLHLKLDPEVSSVSLQCLFLVGGYLCHILPKRLLKHLGNQDLSVRLAVTVHLGLKFTGQHTL